MRSRDSFKKAAALVLSGVLTLGAVPLSPLVQDAHADTAAAEPSAVAYADKTALEGIPTVDGNAYGGDVTKVGRIKLGKDASDKVMEWYILGSDPGVTDGEDNIAIFAASDMVTYADGATGQIFHAQVEDPYTIAYTGDDNMSYGVGVTAPSYVLENHYGMSKLRSTLQSLATSNFTSAEQGIMQATEVDTPDYKENGTGNSYALTYAAPRAVYTTSDVLYAAWGDPRYYTTGVTTDTYTKGGDSTHVYIGSTSAKDSSGSRTKVINLTNLGAGKWFWLRPAGAFNYRNALVAGSSVDHSYVYNYKAVRPASNLKLSSVIFASAASAASSSNTGAAGILQTSAANKDAMMLRLDPALKADGTERAEADKVKVGGVSANAASGTITATKANGAGEVTLIVQGKNADTDWYYTKTITSTEGETVTLKDDIVPALTAANVTLDGDTNEAKAANIDLTKCKIWVETPVMETTSGNTTATASQTLFYAVQAVDGVHTCVEKENTWESNGESHWKICKTCGQQMGDKTECTKPTAGSDSEWKTDDTQHWQNCTVCGKEITSTKVGHTSEWYSGDANNHWQICKVCGKELSSAEEHSFTWQVDKDNSEQHNGTCSCGRVVNEGHTYVPACDEAEHWYECSKCGVEKPDSRAKHTFENGVCTGAGCNYGGKHNITDENREGKKNPTCTEDGYEAYWKCSQKGHEDEVFLESGTGIYVLADATTPIPALGHKPGDEYKTIDGTYCAPVCDRENGDDICGVVITDEKEKHDPDDDGICTRCGYDKYKDEHRHTYDDTVWEDNASYHWHQCTDAECPDVKASIKDKARHTFVGGKCDVCGRTRAYDDSSDDDDTDAGVSSGTGMGSGVNGTWHQDSKGWWLEYIDGSYAHGRLETNDDGTTTMYVAWVQTGGKWYAFDADGYMVKDWVYDAESGYWYYCDADNGLQRGWLYTPVDNCWYYLDPGNGQMMYAATLTPDGCLVGADGAYVEQ